MLPRELSRVSLLRIGQGKQNKTKQTSEPFKDLEDLPQEALGRKYVQLRIRGLESMPRALGSHGRFYAKKGPLNALPSGDSSALGRVGKLKIGIGEHVGCCWGPPGKRTQARGRRSCCGDRGDPVYGEYLTNGTQPLQQGPSSAQTPVVTLAQE